MNHNLKRPKLLNRDGLTIAMTRSHTHVTMSTPSEASPRPEPPAMPVDRANPMRKPGNDRIHWHQTDQSGTGTPPFDIGAVTPQIVHEFDQLADEFIPLTNDFTA